MTNDEWLYSYLRSKYREEGRRECYPFPDSQLEQITASWGLKYAIRNVLDDMEKLAEPNRTEPKTVPLPTQLLAYFRNEYAKAKGRRSDLSDSELEEIIRNSDLDITSNQIVSMIESKEKPINPALVHNPHPTALEYLTLQTTIIRLIYAILLGRPKASELNEYALRRYILRNFINPDNHLDAMMMQQVKEFDIAPYLRNI